MGTLRSSGKASAAVLRSVLGPFVGKEELCEALGYIENAGAPTSVTPDFIGQTLFDTTNSLWYRSIATTAGAWVPDGNSGVAEVVAATNVITAAESGSTFYLSSATEFVSTLPTAALGLNYTFIVAAAPSGASYTIVSASSANIIKGNQNSVAGDAGDFGTADDTITFVDGQSVAGDKVEVFSDGTSWFAYAISKAAAGVTFTQAS